jgi:dinuclear metal center YbgI/SA1388 family protein
VLKLGDVTAACERLWPAAATETWDHPGLMLGRNDQPVSTVLLTVDVTLEVIHEAKSRGCELIISHHPMFMRGVHELGEHTLKGALAALAIRSEIAIFSAHTNADFVAGGVTESLALALGLTNLQPLEPETGHGRVGEVSSQTLLDFARGVARSLAPTASGVRVSGLSSQLVQRIAVAGGAGDSLLGAALASGADVFVTSDLRHHPVQDAVEASRLTEKPMAVIDISHWAAEATWLESAARALKRELPELEFVASEVRTDPWDFAVMQ